MGLMTTKMGPTAANMTAAGVQAGGTPRRLSVLGKLSVLLANIGSAERAQSADDNSHEIDLGALRQRMTPAEPVQKIPAAIRARRSVEPPPSPPAESTIGDGKYAVVWNADCVEQEWKPVVLGDDNLTPAIPSLDDLAEEAGIDPTALRFPVD